MFSLVLMHWGSVQKPLENVNKWMREMSCVYPFLLDCKHYEQKEFYTQLLAGELPKLLSHPQRLGQQNTDLTWGKKEPGWPFTWQRNVSSCTLREYCGDWNLKISTAWALKDEKQSSLFAWQYPVSDIFRSSLKALPKSQAIKWFLAVLWQYAKHQKQI